MARKKDKKEAAPPKETGWDAEDADEALEAEGMKRVDMDVGRVELIDRDQSTPFIETYDEETGELEGKILLKDGNREGLLALVKIIEEVTVDQDHDSNVNSIGFSGKLNVENPSKVNRIWDIDVSLNNIEETDLKSSEIKIRELGTDEDDSIDSREFKIAGEAKNLLLIKEYINTLPDAGDVLNPKDVETDLLKLKDQSGVEAVEAPSKNNSNSNDTANEYEGFEDVDDEEVEEEEDEEADEESGEEWDGGVDASEYSLESYAISIDKENTVWFAIALHSLFEKPISNVQITKEIPGEFSNVIINDTSTGSANVEGDKVVWTIGKVEPGITEMLKFTAKVQTSSIDAIKTGPIEITYLASSSFSGGLEIDKFDAYTRNKFYVDTIERDEEPEIWDCKLVFENSSEFIVELFNADVYSPDDEKNKLVDIDPNDVPRLPAGAQWHSVVWQTESEDYPSFRKKLEFRVMPDFQTIVNSTISISDVELAIASVTGDVIYSLAEIEPGTEKAEESEDLIQVPTFKEQDIYASLKMVNNGSAALNDITIKQQYFSEEYNPPSAEEIKIYLDGNEVELDGDAVFVEDEILNIVLKNLKDSSTGMFEPESTLEAQYPIHAMKPSKDARFESEVIYLANTYPLSNELEFRPEVPVIEAVHLRRKFRIGKEVVAIGSLGQYKIILTVENIGEMPLQNLILLDKVPDSFEYGDYSLEPEITDEVGQDTLKWTLEELQEGEKLEITYEITGSGEYSPSDAQLGL